LLILKTNEAARRSLKETGIVSRPKERKTLCDSSMLRMIAAA
jgi:hypothetical protein